MFRLVGAALAVSCFVAGSVFAGPLAPGQTGNTREEDGITPMPPASLYQGALLAERSQPFRFETVDEGTTQFIEGTFTSRVYRDAETGGFAFLYLLDETRRDGIVDLEQIDINGFGTNPTDVYTSSGDFTVTRSAGGDRLAWVFDQEGIEDAFLVRTPGGTYTLNGNGFRLGIDFEPSGNAAGGTFAAYAPVPEPGAAGVLLVGGAMLLRRVRRA
jgi:hypothetical protein